MKAFLMHADRDFDVQQELPANEQALAQDLELNTLLNAMAHGDEFLFALARTAVLSSLCDPEEIVYRQHVLADCLEHPAIVREIYGIAVEAIQAEKKIWGWLDAGSPDRILGRSVEVLELFVGVLRRLRAIADERATEFRSEGFTRFFAMLTEELDDEYFQTIQRHLNELKFRHGVLISAELGRGTKGTGYVLRRPRPQSLRARISLGGRSPSYSFTIPPRDENGFRALEELRGRGINLVGNALTQSTDHILSFLRMVQAELAFYIGCLNLSERLTGKGEPTCYPLPLPSGRPTLAAQGLYDACLSLNIDGRVVGNGANADGKTLVMITGANQGGKSTFLRSVGLAQLMMQSGMFAPAESFSANVCDGVFTHYKREEDATMESGKLDEELSRMSDIADHITPDSMLLCNESFAATNEREGSEIARQIIRALTEAGIKVVFVTHLFDLAHSLYSQELDTALFLRAEREPDGQRTYRLVLGEPLPTSFGEDSYRHIFGTAPSAPTAAAPDKR